MEDRHTASVGVVLAGFALVAAGLPWAAPGVGPVENVVLAVLGAVAFGTFTLRRRDLLGRGPGALVAGVASLGIVASVGAAVVSGDALAGGTLADGTARTSPWAVALALVGGLGGVVAAYGDGRGLSAALERRLKATWRSIGIAVAAYLAMLLWSIALLSLVSAVVAGSVGPTYRYAISTLALGIGSVTAALVYFNWTDETTSFLDVRLPTRWDLGYAVGGVVTLIVLSNVVAVIFRALGVSVADHSVQQVAMGNPEILLMLVPAAWLIIGPGEELIYRNIIQKTLYDTFSKWGAVAVASVVFALVHIPTYAAGASSVLSVLNTLVVIFLLSMILGGTYLRTGNLVVPILIHGTYDVLSFVSIYYQITNANPAFLLA